ncbi:MAG: NADH-quinone oxidoreductase subunit G, partial [Alphaproteobacteria bacterium]|nr:NADH-quinone oxidoreductase subunit G [Alphaproteobacteria bacterium]
MPKAKVNGVEVEFENGMTVLQVAELAGEEIPRFCYHERLSIAGNCRMCLVEVRPGPPKPQASCALPAADGQEIVTNSAMVKKAREGVMEFLLINHPLDCPICDQGGECDLQDQAMGYGRDATRFEENKRAVEDKFMGPLIKTVMTRCIQCTRCVRFVTEVAGAPELGMISRGENAEITTYLNSAVTSELSANVIDLCPVGALTSRPYAFNARPWELTKTSSIDVMDALGSAIRVDARGAAVLRVLPRTNDAVNEAWISDKTRYACDGLARQRLDRPLLRKGGKLTAISWNEALAEAARRLKATQPDRIGVIAGDLQDAESLKAAKDLFTGLGVSSLDGRPDGLVLGHGPRESWLFNPTLEGLEQADMVVLIGAHPKIEAAVLNARLRRLWLSGRTRFGAIGAPVDHGFGVEQLGEGGAALEALAAGKGDFAKALAKAERPVFILGQGALTRPDSAAVLAAAAKAAARIKLVREGWNGWAVLHTAAARVGALDLGFVPGPGGKAAAEILAKDGADLVFLLGVDEIELGQTDAFVIYMGSHGDRGAHRADLILPGAAYTEKPGLYVNTEGRVQRGERAVFPKGEAKEDWTIFRALSAVLGAPLPYDDLDALRARLFADCPSFGRIDHAPGSVPAPLDLSGLGEPGPIADSPFVSPITA